MEWADFQNSKTKSFKLSTKSNLIFRFLFAFFTENITIECHEECLGGCDDPTANRCKVCRNFRIRETGQCVNKCPATLFVYRTLCVSAEYCKKRRHQPILGECRQYCDSIVYSDSDSGGGRVPSHCIRSCPAVEIDSVSSSDLVRGCQIIHGDLLIRIGTGDVNTQQYLERNLGDIEEVYGYLKIYRSSVITSLSFLRNLRVVRGDNYEKSNYTFQIISNDNLQELWDFNEKKVLRLKRGNLLVQYNSKLCLSQIRLLQNLLGTNKSEDLINIESNGYEQTCLIRPMATWHNVLNHTSVEISWEKIKIANSEKLMGTIIYYMVAPERNVTHRGLDTCVQ